MKVIKHVPDDWTLLEQGRELFLKVHTGRSLDAFSVLFRLDGEETRAYRVDGLDFIAKYARVIDASLATDRGSPFRVRDVAALYVARAVEAIEAWVAQHPEHGPARAGEPPTTAG
jgi:hypothetical protein